MTSAETDTQNPAVNADTGAEQEPNDTWTDDDGVEIVVGPPGRSNTVPLADWGTLYRPDPAAVTSFLGADFHAGEPVAPSATQGGLPAQGYVPPSNRDGDNILKDDPGLAQVKRELDNQANAVGKSPTQGSAVSVSREQADYDPEEKAGDIIPDRDKESDEGSESVPAEPDSEPAQSPAVEPDSEPTSQPGADPETAEPDVPADPANSGESGQTSAQW